MYKATITKNKWKIKEIGKIVCVRILQIVIRSIYIFPLKKTRIVFHSFKGKQYSCNPKAITEYLIEKYPKKFEIVWAFREPEKFKDMLPDQIKTVQYVSLKRVFLEATAGFSINNFGSYNWLPLRKGQIHINTWHGGGCYKKLSTDELSDNTRHLTAKQTSHMISSSAFFSNYVIRGEFAFKNEILETGMPRNDVFFDVTRVETYNTKVRKYYNIDEDTVIVLYAPTWRFEKEAAAPDFEFVKRIIEEKTKRSVTIFTRTHWYLKETYAASKDVTDYPDMQELLCAADVLITDYSSSIWDYSFLYRPCFLYAEDLDFYIDDRGFCKDIYTWGFPVCRTNEELYDAIINFDADDFRKKMEKHHEDLGSFEDGHATEKICRFLVDTLENDQRKE